MGLFNSGLVWAADDMRPVRNVETLINYLSGPTPDVINLVDVVALESGAPIKVISNDSNFNGSAAPSGGFTKTLDGNGLTISGTTSPLIGFMDSATVKNLNFTDVKVQDGGAVSSYVQNSVISNVSVSNAEVTGSSGAVAATVVGSVITDVKVESATISSSGNGGGIVGVAINTVIDSSTVRNVTINASSISGTVSNVGGISGQAQNSTIRGTVDTVTVSGLVVNLTTASGSGFIGVGGVVGSATVTPITQVSSQVVIVATENGAPVSQVGGVVGNTDANIAHSSSIAQINLPQNSNQDIGGLVGTTSSSIESS